MPPRLRRKGNTMNRRLRRVIQAIKRLDAGEKIETIAEEWNLSKFELGQIECMLKVRDLTKNL